MSTFNIKSSSLNNQYEYANEYVTVQGSYTKDATNDTLQSVSGSVYAVSVQQVSDYIGNFNGYMRDNEIKYSISEMSRRNANKVWDAIDDIEANITGANE